MSLDRFQNFADRVLKTIEKVKASKAKVEAKGRAVDNARNLNRDANNGRDESKLREETRYCQECGKSFMQAPGSAALQHLCPKCRYCKSCGDHMDMYNLGDDGVCYHCAMAKLESLVDAAYDLTAQHMMEGSVPQSGKVLGRLEAKFKAIQETWFVMPMLGVGNNLNPQSGGGDLKLRGIAGEEIPALPGMVKADKKTNSLGAEDTPGDPRNSWGGFSEPSSKAASENVNKYVTAFLSEDDAADYATNTKKAVSNFYKASNNKPAICQNASHQWSGDTCSKCGWTKEDIYQSEDFRRRTNEAEPKISAPSGKPASGDLSRKSNNTQWDPTQSDDDGEGSGDVSNPDPARRKAPAPPADGPGQTVKTQGEAYTSTERSAANNRALAKMHGDDDGSGDVSSPDSAQRKGSYTPAERTAANNRALAKMHGEAKRRNEGEFDPTQSTDDGEGSGDIESPDPASRKATPTPAEGPGQTVDTAKEESMSVVAYQSKPQRDDSDSDDNEICKTCGHRRITHHSNYPGEPDGQTDNPCYEPDCSCLMFASSTDVAEANAHARHIREGRGWVSDCYTCVYEPGKAAKGFKSRIQTEADRFGPDWRDAKGRDFQGNESHKCMNCGSEVMLPPGATTGTNGVMCAKCAAAQNEEKAELTGKLCDGCDQPFEKGAAHFRSPKLPGKDFDSDECRAIELNKVDPQESKRRRYEDSQDGAGQCDCGCSPQEHAYPVKGHSCHDKRKNESNVEGWTCDTCNVPLVNGECPECGEFVTLPGEEPVDSSDAAEQDRRDHKNNLYGPDEDIEEDDSHNADSSSDIVIKDTGESIEASHAKHLNEGRGWLFDCPECV